MALNKLKAHLDFMAGFLNSVKSPFRWYFLYLSNEKKKKKKSPLLHKLFLWYHTFLWSLTGFDCFSTFMQIQWCMLPGGLKGDWCGCRLCDDWLKAWWLPWSLKRRDGGPGNGLSPQPWVLLHGSEDCTRWWTWHCHRGAGECWAFA